MFKLCEYEDLRNQLLKFKQGYPARADGPEQEACVNDNIVQLLSELLCLEKNKIWTCLSDKDLLKALTHYLDLDGGLIRNEKIPTDNQGKKDFSHTSVISAGRWVPDNFLIIQLFSYVKHLAESKWIESERLAFINKALFRIKGDPQCTALDFLLIKEIILLIHSYRIRVCYKTALNAQDKKSELLKIFADYLKTISPLLDQQSEFCIPSGSNDHAIYLMLTKVGHDNHVRIDDSSKKKAKVLRTPVEKSAEPGGLIEYLSEVALADTTNDMAAKTIIYNTKSWRDGTTRFKWIFEHDSSGYDTQPKQTVYNCVYRSFLLNRIYRIRDALQANDILTMLTEQDIQCVAKKTEYKQPTVKDWDTTRIRAQYYPLNSSSSTISAARLIIKFQRGDATIEPQDALFIDRFGLPLAFEDFTGREESLALLEANAGQNAVISHPKKTVSGTGGIGKTQLAVTFAYNKLKQFQETQGKSGYRSIIWFIAGTDESIDNQGLMTEQFQRLGQQLGFDPKQWKLDALIKLIFQRLSDEHGPYLVVFDNAPNLRSIKSFCPPSSVPVIITTRNNNERDWDQTFTSIVLNIFTEIEAHAYIKKVLNHKHGDLYQKEDANSLAKALGYFPLALTQALAYITNENMRITDYLAEFRQQKAKYLQHPVAQGDPYPDDKNPATNHYAALPQEEHDPQKATVWAVIQLSLKKVINPNANQILRACAYLAPEAPIDLTLLSYWAANLRECREAVSALRHYSLLENVTLSNHVRIHQLVQEILKLDHDEEAQEIFLMCVAEFIGQHYEKEENPLADEARKKICFPHCQAVLGQIEKCPGAGHSLDENKAALQFYLGNIYFAIGNPAEAVRCYQQALKVAESSQDELRVAKTLVNLGAATQRLGDVAGAKALYERALAIKERTFGPEHPEVATTLVNLGAATQALGDIARAKILYERALVILERTVGPAHPELATTLGNLGAATQTLGDAAGAKALYERALAIKERTFGPAHPQVAKTLVNLGTATQELGDAAGAKAFYERALPILERTYGPEHPEVATTLRNLGAATQALGDTAGAKALLERALAIEERTFGPEHPEMAMTRFNLGLTLRALGQSSSALLHFQHCYRVFFKIFGNQHPYTLNAQAAIQMLQRNPTAALIQPSPPHSSSANLSWISVLSQLLEEPLLLQPHRLLRVAQGCFDAELVSETLALLDCISEQELSLRALSLRAECHLQRHEFFECRETLSIGQALAEEDTTRSSLTTFSTKSDQAQQQVKQWEAELNALKSMTELTLREQLKRVILLRYLRRFEEALSFVNKIMATQPAVDFLAPAYFNQAQCYFSLQRYQEAQKSAEESYRLKQKPEVQTLNQKIKLALEISPLLTQLLDQLAYRSRSVLNP